MEYLLLALIGLQGYFTIFRLTPQGKKISDTFTHQSKQMTTALSEMLTATDIIKNLNQRLSNLETEIKLRQMDSQRLIEWLEKRDLRLNELQQQIEKNFKLEEREKRLDHHQSEIINLGKEIKLIREKR